MFKFKVKQWKLVGPLAFLVAVGIAPVQAATFYVTHTPTGNGSGTSETNAVLWLTARDLATADPTTADTIIFLPGRYNRSNVGNIGRDDLLISVPSKVTVKAKYNAIDTSNVSQRSILEGMLFGGVPMPKFNYIKVEGNNGAKADITIEGFEIDGSFLNSPTYKSSVAGIFMENDCKNVVVNKNIVHEAGGGGIATYNSAAGTPPDFKPGAPGGPDYITITGNRVYNCCFWYNGDPSGISLLGNSNTGPVGESSLTVHNFISRNRIYNNIAKYTGKTHTDGNGIILDLMGGYPNAPVVTGSRPPARTLIENNLIYNNGGRGVHIFKSSNALVRNNTLYENLQDTTFTASGELSAVEAADVLFVNNVVYADGTNFSLKASGNLSNVVYRSNAYGPRAYAQEVSVGSGGTYLTGQSDLLTTGYFLDPAAKNFFPKVFSPGTVGAQKIIDVGSAGTNGVANNNDYASTDIYSGARKLGVQYDRGAFETQVPAMGLRAAPSSASG